MNLEEKITLAELEKFLEKHDLRHFHNSIFEKITTLVIASLGLISALAWDKALHHLFEKIFGKSGSLAQDLFYAILVTGVTVLVSIKLSKKYQQNHH